MYQYDYEMSEVVLLKENKSSVKYILLSDYIKNMFKNEEKISSKLLRL